MRCASEQFTKRAAFDQTQRLVIGQKRPKARAFGQLCAHLTKRCAFGQMHGQMPHVLPIGQMRCAFDQMRKLVKCVLH